MINNAFGICHHMYYVVYNASLALSKHQVSQGHSMSSTTVSIPCELSKPVLFEEERWRDHMGDKGERWIENTTTGIGMVRKNMGQQRNTTEKRGWTERVKKGWREYQTERKISRVTVFSTDHAVVWTITEMTLQAHSVLDPAWCHMVPGKTQWHSLNSSRRMRQREREGEIIYIYIYI